MKASVKCYDGMTMVGETGSGHACVIDASEQIGGRNMGARPMEMVLLSLGACSLIDVQHILRKARQQPTFAEVHLEAQRAEQTPPIFRHILLHFMISGPGLSAARIDKAVALSVEKYCSVAAMLTPHVELHYRCNEGATKALGQ